MTLIDGLSASANLYMDYMLFYSFVFEEHAQHLRFVLEGLRYYSLYSKLEAEVNFLGDRIGIAGKSMDMRRAQSTIEWPTPESFQCI
jgi:hypothetical protein